MRIKCIRCGARSRLALCPDCQVEGSTITETSRSLRDRIPSPADIKYTSKEILAELKFLLAKGRLWLRGNYKTLWSYSTWNIRFSKSDSIQILKDTALTLLPFLIALFIGSKILLAVAPYIPFLPIDQLGAAVVAWLFNFTLGIGLHVDAGAGLKGLNLGGIGLDFRFVVSSLTALVVFLLARKSRQRAEKNELAINPQSEIVGVGATLIGISFILTMLSPKGIAGSAGLGPIEVGGSISVTQEFFSLLFGPMLIAALSVGFGSYRYKRMQSYESNFLLVSKFLKSMVILVGMLVAYSSFSAKSAADFIIFLLMIPTITLWVLAWASGVPLGSSEYLPTELIRFPGSAELSTFANLNLTTLIAFLSLLTLIACVGTIAGLTMQPKEFNLVKNVRATISTVLSIAAINLFLVGFTIVKGSGGAELLENINISLFGSKGAGLYLPNPLLLAIVSALWFLAFLAGARYLSPRFAATIPDFLLKYSAKVRIHLSAHYQDLCEQKSISALNPLDKQTRLIKVGIVKKWAKRGALVAVAFFLVTGPLNRTISDRLSSPESAIAGFFEGIEANDSSKALGYTDFTEYPDGPYTGTLSDDALKSYQAKYEFVSLELLPDESNEDTRRYKVLLRLDGSDETEYMTVYRDSDDKNLLLFPKWTLANDLMATLFSNSSPGMIRTIGDVEIPAKIPSAYLFPGRVAISGGDNFGATSYLFEVGLDQDITEISSTTTIKAGSEETLKKLVLEALENCNNSTEDYSDFCAGSSVFTKQPKFRYPRDLTISDITRSADASDVRYYFNLGFTARYEETSAFDGSVRKTPNSVFAGIRSYIDLSESPQRIRFN